MWVLCISIQYNNWHNICDGLFYGNILLSQFRSGGFWWRCCGHKLFSGHLSLYTNYMFHFAESFLDQWPFTHPSPIGISNNAENENKFNLQVYRCETCSRVYSHHQSLRNHQKFECGKTAQFACPYCRYRCKRKGNMKAHIVHIHTQAVFLFVLLSLFFFFS